MSDAVKETLFKDLNLINRGKVRDLYDLGDSILMVATDRISAFDVILPEPVPGKGKVLTKLSLFWFDFLKDIVPNHLISANVEDYPNECHKYKNELEGRSMLVKKAQPFPVECVARGYISGSGWKSYLKTKEVCGIRLPDNLKESDKLDEPLYTPSTKEEVGTHDINISFEESAALIGIENAEKLKQLTLNIYKKASDYARTKGIIIADTKFEFGLYKNEIILIDEVLTPDSSRFWPESQYVPGGSQPSFDKQFVRDYLEKINWDKTPPAPSLPKDVILKTADKYREALVKIAGENYAV
ncbi:MAG: phosphoribosylaminoimidazolesuccinocarboxamide synthase [Desulforegulaceae bacterium]|jgi:phosphoribosylaminoimidazole-succinocarboxamide synthase|nr:phosphoribosylaminoimidazolesuccinocarboxamide synthase [Desulforegulaceae bacterium]